MYRCHVSIWNLKLILPFIPKAVFHIKPSITLAPTNTAYLITPSACDKIYKETLVLMTSQHKGTVT